jgi:hypothetical protein
MDRTIAVQLRTWERVVRLQLKEIIKQIKQNKDLHVLLLAAGIYFPFLFLGYGSDYDTYRVLWVGRNYVETLDYVPSRVPGFFIFETITYFLDSIGGSFLTNFGSLIMSLLIISIFLFICKRYQVPNYRFLAVILMVHPYFLVNSTCTMDYLFALGFTMIGFWLLLKGKFPLAGFMMALGIGSRLTIAAVAGLLLLWVFIFDRQNRKRIFMAGVIMAVFAFIFYLPPITFAEWKTHIFFPSVGGEEYWSLYLRVGRFLYKSVYFWSPPVFVILIWGLVRLFTTARLKGNKKYLQIGLISLSLIAGMQLFYLWLPTEPSYLIPTIPFWLILIGITFSDKKWVLRLMLALVILSNFVTFTTVRPNVVNQATGAEFGLWVEPGHLVKDVQKRLEYLACGNLPCTTLSDAIRGLGEE